eukprot:gene4025-5036_t
MLKKYLLVVFVIGCLVGYTVSHLEHDGDNNLEDPAMMHGAPAGRAPSKPIPKKDGPPPDVRVETVSEKRLPGSNTVEESIKLVYVDTNQTVPKSDVTEEHNIMMHLFIVDDSLSEIQHTHPMSSGDNTFKMTWYLNSNRSYTLWANFKLNGYSEEYYRPVRLYVDPVHTSIVLPMEWLKIPMAGYIFSLSFDKPLVVDQTATGTLRITDKDGKPAGQIIQPVYGSYAHILAFNIDLKTVRHFHPTIFPPNAVKTAGPELTLLYTPPKPGFVKFFLEMKIDNNIIYVPFSVVVNDK